MTSDAVYCPKCGRKFGDDERFCAKCGVARPNAGGTTTSSRNIGVGQRLGAVATGIGVTAVLVVIMSPLAPSDGGAGYLFLLGLACVLGSVVALSRLPVVPTMEVFRVAFLVGFASGCLFSLVFVEWALSLASAKIPLTAADHLAAHLEWLMPFGFVGAVSGAVGGTLVMAKRRMSKTEAD